MSEQISSQPIPAVPIVTQPYHAPRQTVHWVIAVLLAIIATVLVTKRDDSLFFKSALAQSMGLPKANLEGGRGIYAFSGQLGDRRYGLFMLDVDTGTVWCYEIQRSGPNRDETTLNLVAARSWVFDRYLEEFNTGDPIPSKVKLWVQEQRTSQPPTTRPAGAGTH